MAPVRKGEKRTPAVSRVATPVSAQAAAPRAARPKDSPAPAAKSVDRQPAKAARPRARETKPKESEPAKSTAAEPRNGQGAAAKPMPVTTRSKTPPKASQAQTDAKRRTPPPRGDTEIVPERDRLKVELAAALARVGELEARLAMVSDRVAMAASMLRKLLTDS
jgi:hypothetical protein